MSFLYYDNSEPVTKASFKALKAKELLVWDEELQEYVPVVGGSGGSTGELPYYIKTNSVEIGPSTQKTIIASDGVDIIDNLANNACEITSAGVVLGDVSGNSTLGKETINAANRIRDISQDAAPGGKQMLLYNTSTKAVTYWNQPEPTPFPEWIKENSIESLVGDYGVISLNKDYGGNVEIQNNSNSSLIRIGGVGESGLKIIRNYPNAPIESFLDYCSIDTANKLRNIASTASTAGQSMVTFNPTDSSFKYASIPTAPSWVQPTLAEFTNSTFKTTLNTSSLKMEDGALTNFLLFRNFAEPNNEVQLRWNDTSGNQLSVVGAYSILNKKLLIPGLSGVAADNTGVFCGDVGSTGFPNVSNPYTKSTNLSVSLNNGSNVLNLSSTGIDFRASGVSAVLNRNSVLSANKIRDIASLPTPTSEYKAVIHDPATGNYRYTPIVTPATMPVTKRMVIGTSSGINLPMVTDTLTGAFAGRPPVTKLLGDGDTLLLDTVGETGFGYDTWYAIRVSSNAESVVDCKVLMCSNTNYHNPNGNKTVVSEMYNTPYIIWHRTNADIVYSSGAYTLPGRTLVFKLGNTNTTYSSGDYFQGVISIKMIANSRTAVPA